MVSRNDEVVVEVKNMSPEEMIREAARRKRVVRIVYVDKKDNSTWRETEPYEMKDDLYFGYCLEKEGIRAFRLDQIRSAVMTEKTFAPRWPVKI